MKAYHSLHRLVLLLILTQLSSAQNTTEKPKLVPVVNVTEPSVKRAPEQPVETQQKQPENPPAKVEPVKPQTLDPNQKKVHENECRSSEMLTMNKGCVDRNDYLQSVMLRTWDDENMAAAKSAAGLARSIECAENEIRTLHGCGPAPKSEEARVPIVPGLLYGNKVYPGAEGIPESDDSNEALDAKQRFPTALPEPGIVPRQMHSSTGGNGNGNGHADDSLRIGQQGDGHIIGHNRPRHYVYLPGRLLKSKRKCRPYEVLGKKGRCLRKTGKVGFYKHKDHKYGMQRRHRHEAFSE